MKEAEDEEEAEASADEASAASPQVGGVADGADEEQLDWTPQSKCVFCADGDGKLDSEHVVHHGELVSLFFFKFLL